MSLGLYFGAGVVIVISTIFLFYPKRRKLLLPDELQSLPSKDWKPEEDVGLTDGDGNLVTGGAPRRHRDFPDLVVPTDDNDTICKLLKASLIQYKERRCMGYRQELGKDVVKKAGHDGVEKEWIVLKMKPTYDFFTYDVIGRRIQNLGRGLRRLGLKANDRLAIYEDTRLEWMLTAHACFTNSITVVTVYTNLGDEALIHALTEGEIRYLMTSGRNITKLLQLVGSGETRQCPCLEYILYTDAPPRDLAVPSDNFKLISLSDVEKCDSKYMVKSEQAAPEIEPSPDSLAVIMYTSGSTGNPKGVMLTHRQLAGAVAGFRSVIELLPNDIYLAYLPLAHVLELVGEISMLVLGVCVGYGRPRTLIDNPLSVSPCGDISSLRPTVMAGVPTVFDRIMKGAQGKIKESMGLIQWLFTHAFHQKSTAIRTGGTSLLWDLVFGRTLRKLIGGRVRRILSGGAPLSEKTDEFMRAAFSVPVSQGYGLTETCGCGTVMMEDDPAYRVVGPPVPSVEIRLVDVPEMKYLHTDTVGSHGEKILGRGEIWFRGSNVASGYYKLDETTHEAFTNAGDASGWFRTGDIGQWLANGTLQIIDRKKNLVKTSFGEYIAFEKLESIARNSPYVNNICVYADSERAFAVCIVTPNEHALVRDLKPQDASDFHAVCKTKEAEAFVLKSITTVSNAAKLKPFEIVKNLRLVPEEWTPEDGILSSAGKIKRNVVKERYGDLLDAMYVQGERRL